MKRAMQKCSAVILLTLLSSTTLAAVKPCEELKQEIEEKIQASGVASYTLEIVRNDEVTDDTMIVGSCDGGSKKILYQRND